MKYFQFLITIFFLFWYGCNVQTSITNWTNIDYAGDDTVAHKLDIYLPEDNKSSYPGIIAIYGSAFMANNLKNHTYQVLGKPLLESGFAVITINHRSTQEDIYPAQINDIKAAIRFIRANGNQYRIDTSFIGITGISSGGHLAALAGTSGGIKEYTIDSMTLDIEGKIGDHTEYSSSVDAVVDWFGPTDFLIMDSCGSELVHDVPDSPESLLVGGSIQEKHEMCGLANPITYIDNNDPPFLIFHGDNDLLVPYCQSKMLFEALQKCEVPSEFILVPGAGHGSGLFEEKYFNMMTDFFLEVLNKN